MKSFVGISIEPNPAVEGQPVRIIVSGPGPWYISRDGSGVITELRPNASGEYELAAPPGSGGESFTITDFGNPPAAAGFPIVSQRP